MFRVSNWDYPTPRSVLHGAWDKFVGPGATKAENTLTLLSAVAAAMSLTVYQYVAELDWSLAQQLLAIFISFDVVGGVAANSTSSAKRWYHRNGQTRKHHMSFVASHILHILLVAWGFVGLSIHFIAMTYGALLVSAAIVLVAPARIHFNNMYFLALADLIGFSRYWSSSCWWVTSCLKSHTSKPCHPKI